MFTAEEKTVLYANDRIHFAEDGKYVPGQLLSPDISAFHQVYDWDEQYLQIRSSPEVSVRLSDTAPLSGSSTIPV